MIKHTIAFKEINQNILWNLESTSKLSDPLAFALYKAVSKDLHLPPIFAETKR